jgi:hypothetical protein
MFPNLTLTELFAFWALVAANALLAAWYLGAVRRYPGWALPLSVPCLSYFFNYPLKALYLVYPLFGKEGIEVLHDYDFGDLLAALVFATAFFALLLSAFFTLAGRYLEGAPAFLDAVRREKAPLEYGLAALALLLVVVNAYRLSTGRFYGFNEGGQERTLLENLLLNVAPLQVSVMLAAAIHGKVNGSRIGWGAFAALAAFTVANSLLTTSKAVLIIAFFAYLFYKSILGERVRKGTVALLAAAILAQWVYSYSARFAGTVFEGRIGAETVARNVEAVSANSDAVRDRIAFSFVNRLELLDDLIYTMVRVRDIDPGPYLYGSVVEAANLVPSFAWPGRPFLQFNYFVVYEILGKRQAGVSSSVGRAGEAYFVLGWGGIAAGLLYGGLFFAAYYFLCHRARRAYSVLVYPNLLFAYVIHDNYLAQSLSSLVFTNLLLLAVLSASRHLAAAKEGRR